MFNEYEIVIIFRADLDEAETVSSFERVCASITELGGTVLDKEDWGRRKLAYLINKATHGRYLMATGLIDPKHILEIERRMRFDDRVVRFLVVSLGAVNEVQARIEAAEERRKNQPDIRRRVDLEEVDRDEEDFEMVDLSAID